MNTQLAIKYTKNLPQKLRMLGFRKAFDTKGQHEEIRCIGFDKGRVCFTVVPNEKYWDVVVDQNSEPVPVKTWGELNQLCELFNRN